MAETVGPFFAKNEGFDPSIRPKGEMKNGPIDGSKSLFLAKKRTHCLARFLDFLEILGKTASILFFLFFVDFYFLVWLWSV